MVSTPLKNISQVGSSSQLWGKIKNGPNHQPFHWCCRTFGHTGRADGAEASRRAGKLQPRCLITWRGWKDMGWGLECWRNFGEKLEKFWRNVGEILDKIWRNGGENVGKNCVIIKKHREKNMANNGQTWKWWGKWWGNDNYIEKTWKHYGQNVFLAARPRSSS